MGGASNAHVVHDKPFRIHLLKVFQGVINERSF